MANPSPQEFCVASQSVKFEGTVRFGEDFELDPHSYELRRAGRALKLERIPMEILLLLVEQRGKLATRNQIVERVWGEAVHLDTDNSIHGAIRKIRQVLKDGPEQPRYIQTITGQGYRFIAPIPNRAEAIEPSAPIAVPTLPTPAYAAVKATT